MQIVVLTMLASLVPNICSPCQGTYPLGRRRGTGDAIINEQMFAWQDLGNATFEPKVESDKLSRSPDWMAVLPSGGSLKTTRYFEEQVLRKRPYIRREWCEEALRVPTRQRRQSDGRYRCWIFVAEVGRYLRVVTLEDGETVHNAFPDRNYREVEP
jgi:hypothetical protein